jgi:hypothetical protein
VVTGDDSLQDWKEAREVGAALRIRGGRPGCEEEEEADHHNAREDATSSAEAVKVSLQVTVGTYTLLVATASAS